MRVSTRPCSHRFRPLAVSLARLGSLLGIAAALGASSAHAADFRWDPTEDQSNLGGSGTWDLSSTVWNDNGLAPNVAWPNLPDSVAIFGGFDGIVTINTDAGALTGTGVSANGLVFNSGQYTIESSDAAEVLTLVGASPSITVASAPAAATITATVAGLNGFTKLGAGTLTLSGVNTFSGGVLIQGGRLSVSADENLGAATNGISLANGATLQANGTFTANRVLALGAGGGTIDVAGGQNAGFSAAMAAGGEALLKTGTGTLTLNAASSRSGAAVVTQGTLALGHVAAAGSGDIFVQGATLQSAHNAAGQQFAANVTLDGGTFVHNPGVAQQLNFAAGKALTIGAGGGTVEVSPTAGSGSKLFLAAGQLSGAGTLTKTGLGVMQLSGANLGFSGEVFVNQGTLEFQNADSLGAGVRNITLEGGDFTSTGIAVRHNFTLRNGGILSANGNPNADYQGTINVEGDATAALRFFQATGTGNSFRISGPLTGFGTLTATAPNAQTLTLTGNNSAFAGKIIAGTNATVLLPNLQAIAPGTLSVNGGTMRVQVQNAGDVIVGQPGLNATHYNFGTNPGVASAQFAGDLLYTQPRAFSRIDQQINMPNTTFGSFPIVPVPGYAIAGGTTGGTQDGILWKGLLNIGSEGFYQFSGTNDDNLVLYIDGVQVGTLGVIAAQTNIGNGLNLTAGYHSIVVKHTQGAGGGYATVSYNGPDTGNSTQLLGSVPNTLSTGSFAPIDLGAFSASGGTLDLLNDAFTSHLSLGAGTFTVASQTLNTLVAAGGTITGFTPTLAVTTNGLTFAGPIGESFGGMGLNIAGPSFVEFLGSNTYTGVTSVTGGQLRLNAGGGNALAGDLSISAANNTGEIANVRLFGSNQIADSATLTMSSNAVFDLGAHNDTVNRLSLNGGKITGTGTLTVSDLSNSQFTRGSIFANLSGSGDLTISAGPNTVMFAGQNQYAGPTFISSGTLRIQSSTLGGTGGGNETFIAAGGQLLLAGVSNLGAEGIFAEANNAVRVIGTARLAGALQYFPSATAPELRIDAGGELILDQPISAAATVLKTGAGTLTFNTNLAALPANVQLIEGALGFNGPQSFGAVSVPAGLAYQFNSDPGAGVSLTVPNGATVIAGYALDQNLISRLAAGSTGVLALGASSASNLSFATKPDVSLGAAGMLNTYSGALTPGANGYRLGGGGGQLNVLSSLGGVAPLRVSGPGVVALHGEQAFQGDVTIDGGSLRVLMNGNLGAAGNDVTLTNGGTLELVSALHNNGLIFAHLPQLGNPLQNNSRTITVGTGGGTIKIWSFNNAGNAFALTGVNSLTGSGALTKSGLGELVLLNSADFSGSLTFEAQGGRLELRSAGALSSVDSIELRQATELIIDNQNAFSSRQFPSVNDNNRLNDAAEITLRGGQVTFRARNAAGQSQETIGETTLLEGHSRIRVERNGQGADLTVVNLVRNPGAGTIFLENNGGTFGNTGNEPRMFLTQINGVGSTTTNLIGGWAMINNNGTLDWAAYDATVGVRNASYTAQAPGAFTPAASNVINFTAAGDHQLTDAGGAAHNVLALRFGFNGGQTISFANPNDTLFIGSGGILDQNFNQARAIGTAVARGNITAGSSTAAAGPKDLFFHINQNTTTIESQIVDNNGAVKLIKDLDGTIQINSSNNTFSGGTSIYRGRVNVQNFGGLGSGPVLVKAAALELRAPGATSDTSGILAIDNSEIFLPTGTPYNQAGDRFVITAGSTITGPTNASGVSISGLTRVATLSGPGEVVLHPGAIVRSTNPVNGDVMTNMIANLGTAADLYFNQSAGGGQQQYIHVGAGTPWKGLSSSVGTGWTQGTIFANSDFWLQGLVRNGGNVALTIGSASNVGGYSIVNLAGKPVNAFVEGQVTLAEDTPISLPSDLTFVVTPGGYLQPNISNSFGSGTNVANVLVQAGGTLDPGPFVGIGAAVNQPFGRPYPIPSPMNANVVFEAGGRLLLNDTSGVGSTTNGRTWTMKENSVLHIATTPNVFLGSNEGLINSDQFVWEPGSIVRLETNRIYKHDEFINNGIGGHGTVLELINGNRDVTDAINPFIAQAVGTNVVVPMTLTFGAGGMITNDAVDRQINERRGKIILDDGVTLAGSVGTYLNFQEGFHASAGATIHIGANKHVDGLLKLGGVTFNGAATHTAGAGVTFSVTDGAQLALNAVHVLPDTAALHLPATVDFSLLAGAVAPQIGNGSSLLLNTANYIEIAGPLTGNGAVFTQQDNAALGAGWGATSDFTFDGQFRATTFTARAPSLVKVGPTKMTLTATHDTPAAAGVINSPGAILVYQGEVALAGQNGRWTGGELRIAKGGTLTFDNSQFAVADRQASAGTGNRWLTTLGGGDFRVLGHATDVADITMFGLANGAGSGGFGLPGGNTGGFGKVTVLPSGDLSTLRTSVTFNAMENFQNAGDRKSVWLLRGSGLAGLPGTHDASGTYVPNPANPKDGLVFITTPNLLNQNAFSNNVGGSLIYGAPGTSIVPVRGDLLASVNPAATEGDFATIDVASDASRTGVRVLQASEYALSATKNANMPINVRMTGVQSYEGDTRVQVVKLEDGAGISLSGTLPNLTQPSQFIVNAGGILVPSGASATLAAAGDSVIRSAGGTSAYIHAFGNLNVSGNFFSDLGIVKTGGGTATFAAGSLDELRGRITVHEGTLSLNDSIMNVRNTGVTAVGWDGTRIALNGGTLNINGKDQFFNTFESGNILPGAETEGGTLTSATAARVTIKDGGSFSGHITGAISLHKAGNNTLLLTNSNTLNGAMTIRQGTVLLRDSGSISNVSSIDLNYGRLDIDNGYLSGMSNRLNGNVTLNMRGGDLVNRGRAGALTRENIGTLNALQGHNLLQTLAGGGGATETVIGTLNRSAGATMSFQQNFGFVGSAGDDTTAIRYLIGNLSVNGGAAAPLALTNNIIGGWAIVNNDHFATYDPTLGISFLSNTELGYATYESGDLSTAAATHNVNDGTNRTIAASKAVNAIRHAPGGAQTITLNSGAVLTIASGGLLTNANQNINYSPAAGATGIGLTSGTSELNVFVQQGTTTLGVPVTGDISLTKAGSGTLALTAANTYTGATYAGQGSSGTSTPSGTLNLNLTGANGSTVVAIPGALHIHGTTVTESQPNQIAQTAGVHLYGGAILNLRDAAVTETLASLTLSHASGDNVNRAIVTRANAQAGILNLTAANAITATNDNPWATPTISTNIGTVSFMRPDGPQTLVVNSPVTLNGLAAIGLVFNANIGTVPSGIAGGGLIKAGDGMLVLGGASTAQFGDPAITTEVFNIASGFVRVDQVGALGNANAITTVQDGAVLLLNNNTTGFTGSIRLNDGATLGTTINSSVLGPVGSTGRLIVPANSIADIFTRDYFVPNTNNQNLVVNHIVSGGGTINLAGITFSAGYNAGGLFQLRNLANEFNGTYRIGTGAVLEASTSDVSATGSTIAGAAIELNGGTFRIRDNGDGSTVAQTLSYGNAVTLSADSFIDFDRQSGAGTNKTIAMGALTVAPGEHALNTVYGTGNPIAGNGYRATFSELGGAGTLVKGGSRIVEINAYAAGYTGSIAIAGPEGITLPASGNLLLNASASNFAKFSVSGFHAIGANALTADVLEVGSNAGSVINGWAGITNGEVTGALSVSSSALVSATLLRNNGMISSNGPATIGAQGISGRGLFNAYGQNLTLNGTLVDEGANATRLKTVASAGATVTLTAAASGNTGGAEVQNGILRVAPAGAAVNPLGTGGIRVHGAPAMTAATSNPAVAAVNAVLEFAGSAISQAGDIQNSGTIVVTGGVTTLSGVVTGGSGAITPDNFLANTVPGLLEGRVTTTGGQPDTSGNVNDFTANRAPNPGNFGIKMEPRMGQTNVVTQDARLGWTDNTAWIYTGYFYDEDGIFTFAENVDDSTFVAIDGVTRILSNSGTNPWQTVTSTATTKGQRGLTFDAADVNSGTPQGLTAISANPELPAGWHSIEVRFYNGGGGAGPVVGNGFHNNYGFGLNPNGTLALDGTQFVRPIDPGDGTLFRTASSAKGLVDVLGASTLNVAGLQSNGTLRFSGPNARVNLTGAGLASNSDRVETLDSSALNIAANSTLTVSELALGSNVLVVNNAADLVNGAPPVGTVNVTGTGSGQGAIDFGGGVLNVTGSISGSVTLGDGILAGNSTGLGTGAITGLTDLLGGEVSPGLNGSGMLRLEGGLNFSGAGYSVNINGLAPGTGYDQLNVTGGVALSSDVPFTLGVGFQPQIGDKFTIVLNDGSDPVAGLGSFLNEGFVLNEGGSIFVSPFHEFTISYVGGDGNDIELTYLVPEPAGVALLLGGLATVCARRRRKR